MSESNVSTEAVTSTPRPKADDLRGHIRRFMVLLIERLAGWLWHDFFIDYKQVEWLSVCSVD